MDTFWCNSAARKRAGRLLTSEEQDAVLMALPDAAREAMAMGLTQIHEDVLVRGRSLQSALKKTTNVYAVRRLSRNLQASLQIPPVLM